MLRGVVVTNHGTRDEAVVLAVEGHPWHASPSDAKRCNDKGCKRCHRMHKLVSMIFDFERRRVYPVGQPDWPNSKYSKMSGLGQIPKKDLKKFKADFGLYYSS
jgi:hypothetical protein